VLKELGPRSVSRVSAAARRWCAVRSCESVGRGRYAGGARVGENCACGGVDSVTFSVQRDLCNSPGLASEIEYARSWYLGQVRADLDLSRVEYARRRSSTLDPELESRVRSAETKYSRS